MADPLTALQERRRNKTLLGIQRQALLAVFSAYHLIEKQRSGRVTQQWLPAVQIHLEAAIQYFCNNGKALPRRHEARWLEVPDAALLLEALQRVRANETEQFMPP